MCLVAWGAGPRGASGFSFATTKNYRAPVLFDLARVSGFGRLRRRSPTGVHGYRLLDQVVFGRVEKNDVKLYFVAIMGKSMVKSEGECHGSCDRRAGNGVRSIYVDEELPRSLKNRGSSM